jgi:hypothetical protein
MFYLTKGLDAGVPDRECIKQIISDVYNE